MTRIVCMDVTGRCDWQMCLPFFLPQPSSMLPLQLLTTAYMTQIAKISFDCTKEDQSAIKYLARLLTR